MIFEEARRAEVSEAARALLRFPVLKAGRRHGRVVDLVHEHYEVLREWFDHYLGWHVVLDRDVVRLAKVPQPPNGYESDAPEARCCVLYCLLLASLEDIGEQTVITDLSHRVVTLSASADVRTFDPASPTEKQHLVNAIRLLVEHGALITVQDDATTRAQEKDYVHGNGNAIYDVDRRTAALLPCSPTPPSRAGIPRELTRQLHPETAEGASRRRRHTLMRRLVDEPVVYFADLSEDETEYFRAQRPMFVRQVTEVLDARLEVRAEGIALVDDELSDIKFPADPAEPYAALLFASALAGLPGAGSGAIVGDDGLNAAAEMVAEELRARGVKSIAGRADVLSKSTRLLTKLRLVEEAGPGQLRLLPALGRYRNVLPPEAPQPDPLPFDLALPDLDDITEPGDDHR
ncbi:TIGR02678 family protein [Lentzea sp. NPDC034063]|uniref:TIGR02678 family protein n=1 Tax=unclassified Lentzea TaxID=2643253 RepID=UPI0033DCF985